MPYPSQIDAEAIGQAGLALLEEEGWGQFSLRQVARRLEVAPNALYRHVGDKDGLVTEVGAAAARLMYAAIDRATARLDGLPRVQAAVGAYVAFATTRPDAYRVFMEALPAPGDEREAPWDRVWELVRDQVEAVMPLCAEAAAFALWALVAGRIALANGPAQEVAPTEGLEEAVGALLSGFDAMGEVASPLSPYFPQR